MLNYLIQNWLEALGVVSGLIAVFLNARENPWGWPVGIVSVSVYVVIFFQVFLLGDFLLHLLYVGMGFYGWYSWTHGGPKGSELPISMASKPSFMLLFSMSLLLSGLTGFVFSQWEQASLPYWDALTTVFSLMAQYLSARKKIENWLVWIGVDILCVWIYQVKELYLTSLLYAFYTLLAVYGFWNWKKRMKSYSLPLQTASSWPEKRIIS